MTGSKNYLVRQGFTECDEYRRVMGNTAQLLAYANTGYCLDAPNIIPSGAAGNHLIRDNFDQ